jgi:hypothetical protein
MLRGFRRGETHFSVREALTEMFETRDADGPRPARTTGSWFVGGSSAAALKKSKSCARHLVLALPESKGDGG